MELEQLKALGKVLPLWRRQGKGRKAIVRGEECARVMEAHTRAQAQPLLSADVAPH